MNKLKNINLLKCPHIVIHFCRTYSNRNILKLKERGMFQDIFPDNAANSITDIMNASPQTVYGGFDPTSDSLHVGNLLVLINLLHWQRGGHRPVALIGGATAKIGDPSGRNTERVELSKDFIDNNIHGIYKNIEAVFSNHEKYIWQDKDVLCPLKIVNNEEWYNNIKAVELIGGIGRHLRMGTLLSRASVQSRLNSSAGMSFTEFSYQLFQAYDWLHLFKEYGCNFQKKPELRLPQKRLAEQVTLLVHGEEALKEAQQATEALYKGSVAALGQINSEDVAQLFLGATVVNLLPEAGQDILDLAMKAGCFPTKRK
ncbi:hypothetical protein NQ314_009075 [Rhamnusium bicolor]|uniref:Tyrosine--tRNA ligase n=1 Tax=Rhamnusium bicolor TaxID=1586634 RepID=A0AAV8Y4U0_9CUCU|nr:hypothetical protein NQ314_009075 [Rhamnusium bicolor]